MISATIFFAMALSSQVYGDANMENTIMSTTENKVSDSLLLEVMQQCTEVRTASELLQVIRGPVYRVLPHEVMTCGIGAISAQGNYVHKMLSHEYPLEYFAPQRGVDGRSDSPLSRQWRASHEPVYFQSGRDEHAYPEGWVSLFNRFDLRNTIGHGVQDLTGNYSSYFIFSRLPGEVGQQHAYLLKLLVPHLHLAFVRARHTIADYHGTPLQARKRLSQRQREILYWLQQGKTNWEIAKILEQSELNIKYHIDQIFLKLEVRNRAHAVARGRDLGYLPEAQQHGQR